MFFLPIADDNPTRRAALVTIAVIAVCALVFLWQTGMPAPAENAAIYAYGMIPSVVLGFDELPPALAVVPGWASVVTSMFLHGGFFHIAGNMLFLWIFGNNVEDSMGRGRFLVFYLLCGIAAAVAQIASEPASQVPMIGASGAIGGVLGAYLVLHPRANVRVFAWILIFIRVINVPAFIVLGLWFGGQVLSGLTTPTSDGGVAFWAHVGGFLAGVVLIPFFRRRDIALFTPAVSRPFAVMPPPRAPFRRGSVPPGGQSPWR